MSERTRHTGLVAMMVAIVMILASTVLPLPWWGFVIPIGGIGFLIAVKNWQVACFGTGFLTGFVVWLGTALVYGGIHNGIILGKIAALMGIPGIIVLLITGIIGGLLTGLALYAGRLLLVRPTGSTPVWDQAIREEATGSNG